MIKKILQNGKWAIFRIGGYKKNKMNRFEIKAIGRISGALGLTYPFEEVVICESEDDIWESLYMGRTESKTKWELSSKPKIIKKHIDISTKKE
jgi:hypothetical protein